MVFPVPLPVSHLKEAHEHFPLKLPSAMKMKAIRRFTAGAMSCAAMGCVLHSSRLLVLSPGDEGQVEQRSPTPSRG